MIIMDDKPPKNPKWEKFKSAMKKAEKWTVRNLLPVAVSTAGGGLGLPAALGGLASELFKNFSDTNLNIPFSEEIFIDKFKDDLIGEGNLVEYLQEQLEQANEEIDPEQIKLVIDKKITPSVSTVKKMLEVMKKKKSGKNSKELWKKP